MYAEHFTFQPFGSRAGVDRVTGVRFAYDQDTVAALKALLGAMRARLRHTFGPHWQPGGWLPEARCWWCEPAVWPDVQRLLEDAGYTLEEIVRPAEVPHHDPPPGAPLPPPRRTKPAHAAAPPAPDAPPPPQAACGQCRTALARRWVSIIYTVAGSGETALLGFCSFACLGGWLGPWGPWLDGEVPAAVPAGGRP